MDIESVIRAFDNETDEKRVNDYIKLFMTKYHAFFDNMEFVTHERKMALALNRLTTKAEIVRFVSSNKRIMSEIDVLAYSDDTKVRKNIYTTLSHLGIDLDTLYTYLNAEKSYINILHLIDIIAKYDDVDKSILTNKLATIDNKDAYYIKIADAINNINNEVIDKVKLVHLMPDDKVLLTTSKIGKSILMHDCFAEDIDILTNVIDGSIISAEYTLEQIFGCRSFYEMLVLPKGKIHINCDIDSIAKCINEFLSIRYFNEMFGANRLKYSYRLEVRGEGMKSSERLKTTKNILAKIVNKNFVNIRDDYDFEIRVELDDKCAMVALKLPYDDHRFDYRVGQLPASIHPVTASIIAGIVEPYVANSENILDGFVGTGTMLYELYLRLEYGNYCGVDIENNAIELAHTNLDAIMPNLTLTKCDILTYKPNIKANAIISNMPFGTRVLRHDAIEELYKGFFAHLSELMADDGTACLLTTNGRAIRDAVRDSKYRISHEYRVPSGGLTPYLFVINAR